MSNPFIEQIKQQITQCQSLLEPLESGKLRISEVNDGRPGVDRTQAQIDNLKRTIGMLQSVVDRA
jgi:hypothetical protein